MVGKRMSRRILVDSKQWMTRLEGGAKRMARMPVPLLD
jgi:hypothetical protein